MESNYSKYRGKCKQLCDQALIEDASLRIVRGHYHDAFWGKQPHWWTERADGSIFDPSKLQFPDQNGEYEEFNGFVECSNCGKSMTESDGTIDGNYIFCSGACYYAFVM